MGDFLRRLRFLFFAGRFDRDLAEEMRLHMEMRAADNRDAGQSSSEAAAAARRQFGNATRLREVSREAWGWTMLDNLGKDIAYGARALTANPGFTATAVLSLALGIGANTAIFSIINAVMLRTLPVADPKALVQIHMGDGDDDEVNTLIWDQIRDRQQSFSGTLAFSTEPFDLADGGETHPAQGMWVSGDFFRVLGVPAMIGRGFTAADDRRGGGPDGAVAVVSYGFWQRNFSGDRGVIGKTIHLNRQPFVIVGVTPPWFTGLDIDRSFDVAVPIGSLGLLHPNAAADPIHYWWLRMMGRIPVGQTLQQADDRLRAVTPDILRATMPTGRSAQDQADYLKTRYRLAPAALGFSLTRARYQTALPVLMSTVGLVLLIACANIANLLLARAAARRRELAVRMAIGASRFRVVRQLMTESLLLAALGTAAGFLFAMWGSRVLVRMLSTAGNPIDIDTSPDLRMLAFTVAAGILTALLFGLAPAIRATRIGLNHALKENERGSVQGFSRFHLGTALVAAQVALSLVLLAGAGLFLGTLRNLLTVDSGFDRHNILMVGATLPQATTAQQRNQIYGELLDRFRALPGVVSAATNQLAPIGRQGWASPVKVEGYTPQSRRDSVVFFNRVSSRYFATMRTPLLMGREFSEHDDLNSAPVIVINEETARKFFGAANPLGKTIGVPDICQVCQVIGVVKDTKYNRLDEASRTIAYLALTQDPDPSPDVRYAIRSAGAVESLIPSLRASVAGVDPNISLEFRNFDTQVKESLVQPRMVALLSTIFGSLALLLAMVGLYGATAYSVVRRRGEIGIRMALGAQRQSVVWLMLRDVAMIGAAGMAAGLAVSIVASRLVKSLLYGIRPNDPVELAAAAILLAAAIALAAYIPARRAARLDPMSALRDAG
ncbi:MAG: ABC transporter permease [Candidatus Sulfopaludibacter sp.]|nr:ABC transporter permease [Candidatus Sulfopaludibacter sp.]